MYERLFQPPEEKSYFLFGPRGTGKTTCMRQYYPNALWVNLLPPPHEECLFSMNPKLLKEKSGASFTSKVVIDEKIKNICYHPK
jgi:hypothetical protein